jgi:hypothetical protein
MGLLDQEQAGHQKKERNHVPIADAQETRELEEERDGQQEREIEPSRRVGKSKIKKYRLRRRHHTAPGGSSIGLAVD